MDEIFNFVYEILMAISKLTGFSYKEVNIIVWYILIPFSWAFLIDRIINSHYLKLIFIAFVILSLLTIKDFSRFSNTLFDASADFLRSLGNYVYASVIVCVLLPVVIYYVLIRTAFFRKEETQTTRIE